MHIIFYDTGNDAFFVSIAETFCGAALRYIARRSGQFLQEEGNLVDAEKLKSFLERENKGAIAPLNCGLFFPCPDQDCKDNYKALLTTDQIEYFSRSITAAICTFYKKPTLAKTSRERANLQMAFQGYFVVSKDSIKEIHIPGGSNAVEFKQSDPDKYMSMYVAGVKKILDEKTNPGADIYVYIRAQTGSHFELFCKNIKLPNLKPCDHLQVI